MPSRTRMPEDVRLELPTDGDWIVVKKYLTWGEARDAEVRLYKVADGRQVVDLKQIGVALVVAYLLDWSILDTDGNPIPIRRKGEDAILAAFCGLPTEKGNEMIDAVTKHEAAMTAALEAEKKDLGGAPASSPISVSVA